MRSSFFIPLACCATLCLSLPAGEALGYCLEMPPGATKKFVAWKTLPVEYRVSSNLKDAKILAAIDAAFKTWGTVKCSKLTFKKGKSFALCKDTACAAFKNPKTSIFIFWFDKPATLLGKYISYGYYSHDNAGGFAGASVAVNASTYKWGTTGVATEFDVQNEMTAFVGGVIGLKDSKVAGSSMYNGFKPGDTTKRSLHQDDINGLLYLYGTSACPKPPAPGAGGCSAGTAPPGDGPVKPPADGPVKPPADGPVKPPADGPVTPPADGSSPGNEGSTTWPDSGPAQYDTNGGSTGCTKQTDCAAGELCTIEGKCVKQGAGGEEDDGGCCSVGHRSGPVGPLLLLGLLALLRRRKWSW